MSRPQSAGPRRVLFVDDEALVLKTLTRYFDKLGYETDTAMTGREGIQAFARHDPDVTVLDLDLPDISGMEVLAELRRKRAMVLMLTGHGGIEDAVEAMRLGAENFLTKPINLRHLAVVVEKAIEKRELRRENVRLRASLAPSWRRRLVRAAAFVVLAVVSVGVGIMIGGDSDVPTRRPIPVPIDSADTLRRSPAAPVLPADRRPEG